MGNKCVEFVFDERSLVNEDDELPGVLCFGEVDSDKAEELKRLIANLDPVRIPVLYDQEATIMKLSKKSIDEMLEVSKDVLRDVFFFSERQIHAWQNEVMNQLHDKYGWIPQNNG